MALLATVLIGCSGVFAIWYKTHNEEEAAAVPASLPHKRRFQRWQNRRHRKLLQATRRQRPPFLRRRRTQLSRARLSDLEAKEKTWVSLSSEGKTVFSGVLDPEEIKNFAVSENAKLMTGNAAGLDVRWNGKPIGPIGSRGQVRTVLLSAHTYQILPPRGL